MIVTSIAAGSHLTALWDEVGNLLISGLEGPAEDHVGLRKTECPIVTLVPRRRRMLKVSIGVGHTALLGEDGRVYAFGHNECGQLGLGHSDAARVPTLMRVPREAGNVAAISAGEYHTLVIGANGRVYACGSGEFGQLGRDGCKRISYLTGIPMPFESGRIVAAVTRGNHNALLCENGQVYTFGYNYKGQLGLGDRETRFAPARVAFPPCAGRIVRLSVGLSSTIFLDAEGKVYACGRNQEGQLGVGDKEDRLAPARVEMPPDASGEGVRIVDAEAGGYHTVFLDDRGRVYTCGGNDRGQLGRRDIADSSTPGLVLGIGRVVQIAAGGAHTVLLDADDRAYGCGLGSFNGSAKEYHTLTLL